MTYSLKSLVLISGLTLTGSALAAPDRTDLVLSFLSSVPPQESALDVAETTPFTDPEEGALLSAGQIFELASAGTATEKPDALFQNTELVIRIQSVDESVYHTEILARCEELDLVTDDDIFGATAECDGEIFSYSVDGKTILIARNEEIIRQYALSPGNYTINGFPAVFD